MGHFAPFGAVVNGLEVVRKLYSGYGETPMKQYPAILEGGNAFLEREVPKLSTIVGCEIASQRNASLINEQERNATEMLNKFKAGTVDPNLVKENMMELQSYLADPKLGDKLEVEMLDVITNPMKLSETFRMMGKIKQLMADPATVQQVLGMMNNPSYSDLMSPIK